MATNARSPVTFCDENTQNTAERDRGAKGKPGRRGGSASGRRERGERRAAANAKEPRTRRCEAPVDPWMTAGSEDQA